jgi:hypothetical protein
MEEKLTAKQLEKIDFIVKTMEDLAFEVRRLSSTYQETILKEMQQMRSFMEQSLAATMKEVEEAVKRMVVQPKVYHEKVTPSAVRERVIKKGLDSPVSLIHAILHGSVQPIEVLGALSVIKEKGRLRWSS